ncbi:spherulation-specific family 4 protein [Catellatospora paridis]|uniref:spherulation-specific family 4 protein n=1 Tax=Catellatospora paridis TaxID=1617086 RepID=UPI0018AFA332|nr:spherulation-specific family 4 protein [Catellatospora paridis]
MTTLVPLYVHPLVDPAAWRAVAAAGPSVTAIVNIHNGPGEAIDEAYLDATALLQAARVPMIGYVDLGYLRRSEDAITRDVLAWHYYPVEGVFFDQAPADKSGLAAVARHAARARGTVALNPGTRPHPDYAPLADLICTFEGPWSTYRRLLDEPDWPNAAHLIYGVPAEEIADAHARLAHLAGAGLVSDLDAPLPYCGVPSWLRAVAVNR